MQGLNGLDLLLLIVFFYVSYKLYKRVKKEGKQNENNNLYYNDKYKNLIKKLKIELNLKKEKLLDTDKKYPELEKLKKIHWN